VRHGSRYRRSLLARRPTRAVPDYSTKAERSADSLPDGTVLQGRLAWVERTRQADVRMLQALARALGVEVMDATIGPRGGERRAGPPEVGPFGVGGLPALARPSSLNQSAPP
jgi:hypothetical protein